MEETWLPVVGYGDAYSVSSWGRVMRTSRKRDRRRKPPTPGKRVRLRSRKTPFVPRIIKPVINTSGYPQIAIGPSGARQTVQVHRLVAIAFIPKPDGPAQVNHKNGQKTDNRAANLEWVTQRENALHASRMGLVVYPIGEKARAARLTDLDIVAIRADTRRHRIIAAEYAVCRTHITGIKSRRLWPHVP